jgi:hypothetical protein
LTTNRRPSLFDEESRWLDRFGLVLLLTVVSLALLSLVDLSRPADDRSQQAILILTNLLVGATLLLCLRAAGLRRRLQRPLDVVIVLGVIAFSILLVTGRTATLFPDTSGVPPVLSVVLAVVAPIVVVRRLIQHRVVSRGTLTGAVSAYLLIPVAYFYLYLSVDVLGSEPFFGEEQPTTALMYFSLTTVTTVGYGDLVAVEPLGRFLANSESLLGQLYLVTFVGLLIGLLTRTRGLVTEPDQTVAPDQAATPESGGADR